ncbi:MAG: exonuclease SbcCD subunit D [Clostridia bacterium]|nr:exonuclease SbcCD subunit D [Clostridia bacterium]
MKLFHLADLHIGKQVHNVSMLPDQRYILGQVLEAVRREKPDAVLLSGDIYDKPQIAREAEKLYDWFLTELAAVGQPVLVISGNHDSAAHVGYFSELLKGRGLYTSAPEFSGVGAPVVLEDEHGPVSFWLLPFLKPIDVRAAYPEEEYPDVKTDSYHNAIASVVAQMDVDPKQRNVLLCHQFVVKSLGSGEETGVEKADSETLSIGGLDCVGAALFDVFDYVALGHLHRPQKVGRETVRYCGTPLKYSFSEANDHKSITVVELGPKGDVHLSTIPLTPQRDMRRIAGSFEELTSHDYYAQQDTDDYLEITLTDDTEVPGAFRRLQQVYPNLLSLRYEKLGASAVTSAVSVKELETMDPFDLVSKFFREQTGKDLGSEQERFLKTLMTDLWGGEDA